LAVAFLVAWESSSAGRNVASAQSHDDGGYQRLVGQALAEYEALHYAEALELFQDAYERRPTARVLRGIGKSLFGLERYVECVDVLRRALASDVEPLTPALRDDVEQLLFRAE
jgi:tetratricopeptide (TPR) repeat protein